jgi:ribosomal protein S18 acetylase RimI-like enzyme
VHLREAVPSDYERVKEIHDQAFPGDPFLSDRRAGFPWHELRSRYLIAESDDGTAVGYARIESYGWRHNGHFNVLPEGSTAILKQVAVAPAFRGRGWGRTLIDNAAILARTLGYSQMFCLTSHDLLGFYKAAGWVEGDYNQSWAWVEPVMADGSELPMLLLRAETQTDHPYVLRFDLDGGALAGLAEPLAEDVQRFYGEQAEAVSAAIGLLRSLAGDPTGWDLIPDSAQQYLARLATELGTPALIE